MDGQTNDDLQSEIHKVNLTVESMQQDILAVREVVLGHLAYHNKQDPDAQDQCLRTSHGCPGTNGDK